MAWQGNNNGGYGDQVNLNRHNKYTWLAPLQLHSGSETKRTISASRSFNHDCVRGEQHHILLPPITRSPRRPLVRENFPRMPPTYEHLSSDLVFNGNPHGQKRRPLSLQQDFYNNNQYEDQYQHKISHVSQQTTHSQYNQQQQVIYDSRHLHRQNERTDYNSEKQPSSCLETQHHGRKGSLAFILDSIPSSTEDNNVETRQYFNRESYEYKYSRQTSIESQNSPSIVNESTGSECSYEEKATPSHASIEQQQFSNPKASNTHHTISPAQANSTRTGKTIVKKSRICKVEDCTRYVVNRGLCIGHGGGKRCAVGGCTSSAKNLGVCWKHGGSTKCTVADCENRAKSRGVCWSHGGGRKCKTEGCEKTAVSNGLCWAHGGGKRCIIDGCKKPAYERNGNVCSTHQINTKLNVL